MNYEDWNNAIAEFFFNEAKDGTEVKLFITREDIIDIGRNFDVEGSDQEVIQDYFASVKLHLKENQRRWKRTIPVIDVPSRLQKKWKTKGRVNPIYPPYIGYLVLFILPLTQISTKITTRGYYNPLIHFLRKHDLLDANKSISTPQFKKLDPLWYDLEEWSIDDKNTELGYFELHPFRNRYWKYVGKPLTQCIIPRKAINKLPSLFDAKDIPPGLNLNRDYLKDLLIKNGANILDLKEKTLRELKEGGELCDSIINLVKRKYDEWEGLTELDDQNFEKPKQGYTLASLNLCLSLNELNAEANVYYRLHSKMEYPEDLYFDGGIACKERGDGWSQKLHIPFKNSKTLIDKKNKWKAVFKDKDLRLFVIGKYFNLVDWVEVDSIVPSYDMLLMCKEAKYQDVKNWIRTENNKELNIKTGRPEGYYLFRLKDPQYLSEKIPELEYLVEKKIIVEDGIKIGNRSYLKDPLPKIRIENGSGSESVYIKYRHSQKKIYLERNEGELPIWRLPKDIEVDRKFNIKIDDEPLSNERFYYRIENYRKLSNELIKIELPKRNKFEKIVKNNPSSAYILGNSVQNFSTKRTSRYSHYFLPSKKSAGSVRISYTNTGRNEKEIDRLLYFLSSNKVISWRNYRTEFDTIYRLNFSNNEIDAPNRSISKLRYWALYYLQSLGHIEYDKNNRLIYPCPAKLIYIHTQIGREALLIGHRSPDLIDEITTKLNELNLSIKFFEQEEKFKPYLLPQKILITGYSDESNFNIDAKIRELSDWCNLGFSNDYQTTLIEFVSGLDEYIDNLKRIDSFLLEDYPLKKFDISKIKYVEAGNSDIDKTLSLVRYKINEYKSKNVLWFNEEPYQIDPYWGRYYILKKNRLSIILYDEKKEWLAVPATVPLPMFFSKAFTLLSGTPPNLSRVKNSQLYVPYNIYEKVPRTIAHNYLKKLGQTKKQIDLNI